MRYSAPRNFTAVKTAIDRSTIAPMPTATRSTCEYAPIALPPTVSSAALRPNDTARLTTNITLGPGMMMIANATAANPISDDDGGTGSLWPSDTLVPLSFCAIPSTASHERGGCQKPREPRRGREDDVMAVVGRPEAD